MQPTGKPKSLGWPAKRFMALAAAVAMCPLSSFGQSKEEASRLFFKGDVLARQAEQYAGSGRDAQARQAYENAISQFSLLSREYPDYSPAAVERRLKDTRNRLKELGGDAEPPAKQAPQATKLTGKGGEKEKAVAQQLANPAPATRGSGPMLATASAPSGLEQDPMALLRAATPRASSAKSPASSAKRPDRETGPSFKETPAAPRAMAATPPPAPAPKPARGSAVGADSLAVEAEVQKGQADIDALNRQLNEAERKLIASKGHGEALEGEIKALRERLDQSQRTIEESRDLRDKLVAMEDKLKQMELVTRKQTEVNQQELARKDEELKNVQQALTEAKKREEEAMESRLRERLTKLAEERVELMQKNDDLSTQLRTVNAELAKFKDAGKGEMASPQLRELEARIAAQTKDHTETLERLKGLQNELKSAHDEAQDLREKLAAADAGKADSNAHAEELAEYKRRSEQAAKLKLESLQEIGRLRAELGTLNETLAKAQKERDDAIASSASDKEIAADLAKVRGELTEAEKQRDHLAQRVSELQAAEKSQGEQSTELQNALAEARSREEAAQAELKKSIALAKEIQAPLAQKVSEMEKSQVETLNALNHERQQVAKLETELDLLKKENTNLQATVEKHKGTPESETRIAELTQTLETVRRDSAKLQEERKQLQLSKAELDKKYTEQLGEKERELVQASKALAEAQAHAKNLEAGQGAQLTDLKKEKSRIEFALTEVQGNFAKQETRLKEVETKLAESEKERLSLEGQLKQISAEHEKTLQQNAALTAAAAARDKEREDAKTTPQVAKVEEAKKPEPKAAAPKEEPKFAAKEEAVGAESNLDLLDEALKIADSADEAQAARKDELAKKAAAELEKNRNSALVQDKPVAVAKPEPAKPAAKETEPAKELVSLDSNGYELPLPGELPTAQALSASRSMNAIARGEAFDASLDAPPPATPMVTSKPANPAGLPDDMADLAREAKRYFETRQYPQAEKAFEKIIEKEPENVFALSNLGVVRFRMKKLKPAEEVLLRAVKVDAEDAFSWETLGIVYYSQNRIDEAIEVLSRSISIDSQSATAHNFLGIASSKKGWPEAAEDELRKAITLNPNYADAHFNLAVLYATSATPSNALARQHYQKAVSLGAAPNPSLDGMIKNGN